MVNFIVCDDDKKYRNMVDTIITAYMMKNELEYKVHLFKDYDINFMEIVNTKLASKIYILDIETPTRSGIDIAKIIRNKDIDSILIFLTGHQELGNVVLKNDFLFLSFINKFDNCETHLEKAIAQALKLLNQRKSIRFKDSGTIYNINLDDILYITRESVERKCVIKTDYASFKLNMNLTDIYKLLTDDFIQTHRACIVNKKRRESLLLTMGLLLI